MPIRAGMSFVQNAARTDDSEPGTAPFIGATKKLSLGSLDDSSLNVFAQYNPAELKLDQQFGWADHKEVNAKSVDALEQEFGGMQPQTATIELLFDSYETGWSVKPEIDKLRELASVRDAESGDDHMRRPHFCVMTWADERLQCVITALSVKYTMFSKSGRPLRASVAVTIKQASRVTGMKKGR